MVEHLIGNSTFFFASNSTLDLWNPKLDWLLSGLLGRLPSLEMVPFIRIAIRFF